MIDLSTLFLLAASILLLLTLYIILHGQRRAYARIVFHETKVAIKNIFMNHTKEQRVLQYVLDNATRGDPQSVIDNVDRYCHKTEWAMNVGDQKGLILDNIVKETNPSVCLELGTYCGYSAVRIARLLKPGARFFTVEFNPAFAAVAKQMLEFAGVNDKVQILEGNTQDIIPQLKKKYEVDTLDFVFVDHWKDKYTPDTKLLEMGVDSEMCTRGTLDRWAWEKSRDTLYEKALSNIITKCNLLRKGSVILADNVIVPGAPDFLEYVRTCGLYDCTNYPSFLEYMDEKDALEKAVFRG